MVVTSEPPLLLLLDTIVTFDHTRTRQVPVVKDGSGNGSEVQGWRDGTWPEAQNRQEQGLPEQLAHESVVTWISNAICWVPLSSCCEVAAASSLFHERRGVGESRARGAGL